MKYIWGWFYSTHNFRLSLAQMGRSPTSLSCCSIWDLTARKFSGNNLRVHFFSQTVWETCQSLCALQRKTARLQLVCSTVNDSWSTRDESCLADYEIPRWQNTSCYDFFKKRISGLLPLIMLFDLCRGGNWQELFSQSRLWTCYFHFLIAPTTTTTTRVFSKRIQKIKVMKFIFFHECHKVVFRSYKRHKRSLLIST